MAQIAVLIPDLAGGGAERVALTLAKGFVERGHSVDLVLLQARGELMELVPEGVRIVDLKSDRFRRAIRPLADYLKDSPPDALLAMMWPMPVVAWISRLLSRAKFRIVSSDHAILSQHYRDKPAQAALLRVTGTLVYPRVDARIAASNGIASDLAVLSGLERDRISVIPNPIAMPPNPIVGREHADSLWPGSGARILAVGALKPEKNHTLLLRAFARLAEKRPAQLIILGEGPLRRELTGLADRLGIAGQVAMPGFHPDPWPFYASADLFVLSSDTEGFGNVLVEAMAVGLPVVSTDCDGPRELLEGGKFGQLVPVGDELAMLNAMELVMGQPVDPEKLKQRAKQFQPDQAVDGYLSLLLGHGRGLAA
jgi:glycosyltransferase involved in cell wall biosynthesis